MQSRSLKGAAMETRHRDRQPTIAERPPAAKVSRETAALLRVVAARVAPLEKRVDALENVVRAMVEARARNG